MKIIIHVIFYFYKFFVRHFISSMTMTNTRLYYYEEKIRSLVETRGKRGYSIDNEPSSSSSSVLHVVVVSVIIIFKSTITQIFRYINLINILLLLLHTHNKNTEVDL